MGDLTFGARNITIGYCKYGDESMLDKQCKHTNTDVCKSCSKIHGKESNYEPIAGEA